MRAAHDARSAGASPRAGGASRSAASTSASIIQRTTASVSRSVAPQMSLRITIEHPIVTRSYAFSQAARRATGGRGADVIYDGLGRDAAAENLAALAMRGHWVSYGHATGPLPPVSLAEKSGSLSQPVLFHYTEELLQQMAGRVFAALRDGILRPDVRHRYPLAAAADAHRDLEARRTSGQILLLP